MGMLQEAFEKGAANRLGGGDYAYSYAPPVFTVNTPLGQISGTGFIGPDRSHNWDYTNVRTVVLDVTDCQHPILSTGSPGLARPSDRVNGSPVWKPVSYVLR